MKTKLYFTLACGLLLAAGCSDSERAPFVANDVDVEIVPSSGLNVVSTRGDGVVDPELQTPATAVTAIRIDQSITTGAYPTDYTDTDLVSGLLNGTLSGNTTGADYDDTNPAAKIVFANKEYFLPGEKKTKIVAVYPQVDGTTITWDASTGKITYPIDGSTDIMSTGLSEGYKYQDSADGYKTKCNQPALTFGHLLTQIYVRAYAVDADARDAWGAINSVTLTGSRPTVCSVILPATISTAATDATSVEYTDTDDVEWILTEKDGTSPSVMVADGDVPTQAEIDDDSKEHVSFGYCMFAPVATAATLPLTIESQVTSGSAVTTPIVIPEMAYEAGKVYTITLKLTATEIIPQTVTIREWVEGDAIDEVEI